MNTPVRYVDTTGLEMSINQIIKIRSIKYKTYVLYGWNKK